MVPSGFWGGGGCGCGGRGYLTEKFVRYNKSCLSMVPKRTLWAVDRHTLDKPV